MLFNLQIAHAMHSAVDLIPDQRLRKPLSSKRAATRRLKIISKTGRYGRYGRYTRAQGARVPRLNAPPLPTPDPGLSRLRLYMVYAYNGEAT